MSFNLKLLMTSLLLVLSLFSIGCSGGGGGSSPTTPPPADQITTTTFGLNLASAQDRTTSSVSISDYTISIKRNGVELMNSYASYIDVQKNSSGDIVIAMKYNSTDSVGLQNLIVGDVITFEAVGYTPQQVVVTQQMLNDASVALSIKPIESRQTFALSDLVSGGSSVAPRKAFGARTLTTDESVIFETNDQKTQLIVPKISYEKMVRKIARLPRSTTTTQVFLDITSVDPKTEHGATIGDFSYDPNFEPASERATSAIGDTNYGLESVVMSDIKMTTDAGDEIHCFGGGDFDPLTNKCDDGAEATLRMLIPQTQFEEYAKKYNDGERVVPLYAYSQEKATWVRQLDASGSALNAELILTDNDNNQRANEGDSLYLEGKVGHFSWWNGDYAYDRTCLDVTLDLSNSSAVSHIYVEGVDYSGRTFTYSVDPSDTQKTGMSAKANAIVKVSLVMSSGEIGDSIVHSTGAYSSTCEDIGTLRAPNMNEHNLTVNVVDINGSPISGASVSNGVKYATTGESGQVTFDQSYNEDHNVTVSASYTQDGFNIKDTKTFLNSTTSSVTFAFDIRKVTFSGQVVEMINNKEQNASNAYVYIYGNGVYQSAQTDANGQFSIDVPQSKVDSSLNTWIYVSKYNQEYAYSPYIYQEITLDKSNTNLGKFTLGFYTHEVTGRVTNSLGDPIAGATVRSNTTYRATSTDSEGYYKLILINGQNNATEQLVALDRSSWQYSPTQDVVVNSGTSEVNFVIDQRKATIQGAVVSPNGVALEGMRVYWSKDWSYTQTDSDGAFTLETYYEGDGYLRVYDPNTYKYLEFSYATDYTKNNVNVSGVKKGEITDVGNLQVVSDNIAPIIKSLNIDPKQPLYGKTIALNVDAYDADGDVLTYNVTQIYGDDAAISQNGNQASIDVNSPGYRYFKVDVSDGKATVARTTSFYVKSHTKPVIRSIYTSYGSSNFDKASDALVSVDAYSDEGNTLSYEFSLVDLATYSESALSATENNATIPSTLANGRYKLVVKVSDAYNVVYAYRYFIADDTVAPEISAISIGGVNMSSSVHNMKASPARLAFKALLKADTNSTLTWRWSIGSFSSDEESPSEAFETSGYYRGYVSVRDERGRSDYKYFYVNVQENQKPVIAAVSVTPDVITKSGTTYLDGSKNPLTDVTLDVNATDADGTNLTYTFGNIDNNDSFIPSVSANRATYALAGLNVGTHAMKVSVGDGTSTVSKFVNFTVKENTPPLVTSFIVPLKAKVSTQVKVSANAQDANSDALTYKWSSDAQIVLIADPSASATSVTLPNSEGNVTMTLSVSDGDNTVSKTAKIQVVANQKPIINSISVDKLTALKGDTVTIKSSYGDPDGTVASATYKVTKPDDTNVSYTAASDLKLVVDQSGTYKVSLSVTDNDAAITTSREYTISVTEPNREPVIASLSADKIELLKGEVANLTAAASDPDAGDAITFTWSANGGTLTSSTTNVDKATFSATTVGTYTITLIVTDKAGLKALKTLQISVFDVTLSSSASKQNVTLGEEVTFSASFSSGDAVPSAAIWSVTVRPSGSSAAINANGATATFTPDSAGTYTIKVQATLYGITYEATSSISASEATTTPPSVDGYVTSGEDTLVGAQVRLYNKDDATIYDVTTTSDASGYFKFDNVPSGTYYLVTYAGNGYIASTQVITITGAQ